MNASANHDAKLAEGFHNSADGLWDVLLGLCFVIVPLSIYFNFVVFAGPLFFLLYLILRYLKNKVTYPRIGYATYTKSKNNVYKGLLFAVMIGGAFFALGMVAVKGAGFRNSIQPYILLFLGVFFSAAVLITGRAFQMKRFTVYSVLVLLAFLPSYIIHVEDITFLSLTIGGGIIMLSGIVTFIRFLRKYPKLEADVEHE